TTPAPVPSLSIRHDEARTGGLRYLRAAALAWRPVGQDADLDIGGLDETLPPATRELVWLGAGSPPPTLQRWVKDGGTALAGSDMLWPDEADRVVVWRDALGRPLVEATPLGSGRLMRFTRPLTPADMP